MLETFAVFSPEVPEIESQANQAGCPTSVLVQKLPSLTPGFVVFKLGVILVIYILGLL